MSIQKVAISPNIGEFKHFSNSEKWENILNVDTLIYLAQDNFILYNSQPHLWIRLSSLSDANSINISINGKKTHRRFKGDIILIADKGKIKIINEVNLEKYVEGVVKGEVGYGYPTEYYKLQAIISRTYGLKERKHLDEGIDLCDQTHCQVYKGINYLDDITLATNSTEGEILCDENGEIINAVFHANCGGQTSNSEDVWLTKVDYLRSIEDTSCIHTSLSRWKREISKEQWINFLLKKGITDSDTSNLNFEQKSRKKYIKIEGHKIKLTELRNEFGLKSTYFDIQLKHNVVLFAGRGYGHGVGLCQEGAIEMCKQNINYKKVLLKYYSNIHILNFLEIEFYDLF